MHFLSKLHSNAILTGSLDSYCLVCDNYLRSEDEAFTHTEKPIHRKNLGMAVKVEKFLDDRIVKVKTGYYCPYCNILLSTTTKVNIHIIDINHIVNKRSQVSRIGDSLVACDEIAITLESWHGIMDNTCIVCNEEFEDDEGHSKNQTHVLKLIQNKCEFGVRFIYRKVDEDSFFCLICNNVFAVSEKLDHHETFGHRNQYDTGRELKRKLPPVTQTKIKAVHKLPLTAENNITNIKKITVENNKTETRNNLEKNTTGFRRFTVNDKDSNCNGQFQTEIIKQEKINKSCSQYQESDKKNVNGYKVTQSNVLNKLEINGTATVNGKFEDKNLTEGDKLKSNVLDRVEEFQKKGINIDFTSEKARCKKCYENILFNTNAIEKHIEQHETKKIDNGEVPKTETKKPEPVVEHQTKEIENNNDTQPKKVVKPNKKNKKQKNKKQNKNSALNNKTPAKEIVDDELAKKSSVDKLTEPSKTKNELKPDSNDDLEALAKENQMVIMSTDVFCPHCKVSIQLNVEDIKTHINLSSHTTNLKVDNTQIDKKISLEYIKTMICVESNLGSDLIINEKYMLNQNSFHSILTNEEDYFCMLCESRIETAQQLMKHINSPDHTRKLSCTKVIISLPEEFLRELNPDKYHCGYCNMVITSWSSAEDHLSSPLHKYAKRHSQWEIINNNSILLKAKFTNVNSMLDFNYL